MTISALIDKQDGFEIVRDQIGAILAIETQSQMALAIAAGKDPLDWKLNVYLERANPWEQWLNDQSDRSPIINVWWDNSNYDGKASNISERQKSETVYNIDCYGFGLSSDDGATGHLPGDRAAAFDAARAVRLCRNILMAAEYTYLGLRGLVWKRWPQSITSFQPQQEVNQAQQIVGARISFRVEFNETSPQVPAEVLELLSISIDAAEDGQLLVEADYDYS